MAPMRADVTAVLEILMIFTLVRLNCGCLRGDASDSVWFCGGGENVGCIEHCDARSPCGSSGIARTGRRALKRLRADARSSFEATTDRHCVRP